ncbi:MAG: FAD-dependent oxidoreductase [Mycobacterium sp.]
MRVVVTGGRPAGVSAALHAAGLGAEVTLIERGRVGGTALNRGPAPIRTLARAARPSPHSPKGSIMPHRWWSISSVFARCPDSGAAGTS